MLNPDLLYLLSILIFFGALLAQGAVFVVFQMFKNAPTKSGMTPKELAQRVMADYGTPESLETVPGSLNDHYDPRDRVVRLSADTANNSGLSAVAVTAHELGHAIQHVKIAPVFAVRNAIAGIANIATSLGYILFIAGLILSFLQLSWIGIALFATSTLFLLLTLPIEIDASIRGLSLLRKYNVVSGGQMGSAVLVLGVAALTYLLALLQSLVQLLRFIAIASSRRD